MLFDNNIKQWCEWGEEFVKIAWNPIDLPTTEQTFAALQNCGRKILLSFKQVSLENAQELAETAAMCRISPEGFL